MKPTKEFLDLHYTTRGLSSQEVGELCGLTKTSIIRNLKKYGIPLRGNSRQGRKNRTEKDLSEFINKEFGRLTVIGFEKGHLICSCLCGNQVKLKTKRLTYDNQVSCGCTRHDLGPASKRWNGGLYVPGRYFASIKSDAVRRGLEFKITLEQVDSLVERQQGLCALSHVPISFAEGTASLDRIDSSRGYTPDNIQLLHKIVNEMKWDYLQDEFLRWCRLLAAANPVSV